MHLEYGKSHRNVQKAVRFYAECFQDRQIPYRSTFVGVAQRLLETGSLIPLTHDHGPQRPDHVLQAEDQILNS
ncbi:hypothetical protein BDFB_012803 [Asbolus verrucosus]|uniref:DUF4817 domain-containing protein n=1 Tax=Asbolus verrucosus TaxID=1661398 RepID=A0A482VRY8_ASBVE|nr:hypothetical protein BDFB_012803 [Asbolus verrucosus]